MKLYRFKDTHRSEWLVKYNDVIRFIESGQTIIHEARNFHGDADWNNNRMTLHHIIPRSVNISLKDDKKNHVYLNFYDHAMMHYYLWKHDKKYARQLWFMATYGRKHHLWDFPGGDEEYEQLKYDLRQ